MKLRGRVRKHLVTQVLQEKRLKKCWIIMNILKKNKKIFLFSDKKVFDLIQSQMELTVKKTQHNITENYRISQAMVKNGDFL